MIRSKLSYKILGKLGVSMRRLYKIIKTTSIVILLLFVRQRCLERSKTIFSDIGSCYFMVAIRTGDIFLSTSWLRCFISVRNTSGFPLAIYTAQQKFSMDFIFVLILVRIRNDFLEVINKCGNP